MFKKFKKSVKNQQVTEFKDMPEMSNEDIRDHIFKIFSDDKVIILLGVILILAILFI